MYKWERCEKHKVDGGLRRKKKGGRDHEPESVRTIDGGLSTHCQEGKKKLSRRGNLTR